MQDVAVKVSSRHQIALPSRMRRELDIQPGDRLLVDIQDGMLLLVPEPTDYVTHLAGLHREVWADIDVDDYLREERDAWSEKSLPKTD